MRIGLVIELLVSLSKTVWKGKYSLFKLKGILTKESYLNHRVAQVSPFRRFPLCHKGSEISRYSGRIVVSETCRKNPDHLIVSRIRKESL